MCCKYVCPTSLHLVTKLSKNVHLVGRCNQYQMFTCLAAGNVFMEHTQVSTALKAVT